MRTITRIACPACGYVAGSGSPKVAVANAQRHADETGHNILNQQQPTGADR